MSGNRLVYRMVLVLILVAVLVGPSAIAVCAEGPLTVTILHTNDTHARLESFSAGTNLWQGGVARRYTAIQKVKAEAKNVLLVDAGDAFQGTLFFNQWQGEETSYFMNALGYQAMAVGNHELDSGPGTLRSFVRAARFPVLSANLDATQEPELAGHVKPYAVLEVGGERIGLFGLITPETSYISSPGPRVKFLDPIATAKAMVKELESQGLNKIVCLSHLGYDVDQALAKAVDGLDVIVGGHSHTLLGEMKDAAGPYPTVVKAPAGGTVLVVSANEWGRYLGRLEVTFSPQGAVQSYKGAPILVDNSVAENADIAAQVARFAQPINALRARLVGRSAVALEGNRDLVRSQETNLGNLICDAMLWKTASEGTQIAITNGGGVRAGIPAGDVSMGHVLEVLPFGNQIATMGLKGADVVAALERGVSEVETKKGQFPQVGGLRYRFDPSKAAGSRVSGVEVKRADGSYAPIELNTVYKVVTNDFMRKGGDGYTMFAQNAINPYDGGAVMADALADYIRAFSPVSPKVEGRITAGSAVAPAAAATTTTATAAPAAAKPTTTTAPALGGQVVGSSGGAMQYHDLTFATRQDATVTLRFWPDDPIIARGFGFVVWGPSGKLATGQYAGTHGTRVAKFAAQPDTLYRVQVYNYLSGTFVSYAIEP